MPAPLPPKSADEFTLSLKRKRLFMPCKSKEELHKWIKIFLGLDMPDNKVDSASTTSPMDFIWDVYNTALTNNIKTAFSLSYACRDGFKTLSMSILELLLLLHFARDVAHMAAIESQSKKAQNYIKGFCNKPVLRYFLISKNEREIVLAHYRHKETGEELNITDYTALPFIEQSNYDAFSNYIVIVICSLSGANGVHSSVMVVDEIDIIQFANIDSYEESKFIPGPSGEKIPITIMTSSRKFSRSLVQKEIDASKETGLIVSHWNILDVSKQCQPERHRPDLPKIVIYRSDDLLKAISEDDYKLLNDEDQKKYIKDEGYWGCLNNCTLFDQCRTALTKQTCQSPLLKPIEHVSALFARASIEKAKAQLMCWKPESGDQIFPRFDRNLHVVSAAKIANMLTDEEYRPNLSKTELIQIMIRMDIQWFASIDHGYTHACGIAVGGMDANRMFIVEGLGVEGLELMQRVSLCKQIFKPYPNLKVYGDTAAPSDNKTFKRSGINMVEWDKGKDTVLESIEIIRSKLMPVNGKPEMFILDSDSTALLVKQIEEYHWKRDQANHYLEEPEKIDDDVIDACRYLMLNACGRKGAGPGGLVGTRQAQFIAPPSDTGYTKENFISRVVGSIINSDDSDLSLDVVPNKNGPKFII